jgi:hypothetical protein
VCIRFHVFSASPIAIVQDSVLLIGITSGLHRICQWVVEVSWNQARSVSICKAWGKCDPEIDTFHRHYSGTAPNVWSFENVSKIWSVSVSRSKWRAHSFMTMEARVSRIKVVRIYWKSKCKPIPVQDQMGPEGYRRLRVPGFSDNRHMKVARLSV